jgi:hypothetical protein
MQKFLIIWTVLVLTSEFISAQPAQPRMSVDNSEHDFGLTPQKSIVAHHIWVKSAGDSPLQIRSIKTGCGCVAATPAVADINPGDSLPITFYWDTRISEGSVKRTSYMFTNADADPFRFEMKADCYPSGTVSGHDIFVSPSTIIVAYPRTGGTIEHPFSVTNRTDEDRTISIAAVSVSGMEIIVPDTLLAGSTIHGRLLLDAEDWSPELAGSMTIEFPADGSPGDRVTIPITGGQSRLQSVLTKTRE